MLFLLYGPALTAVRDHWEDHSLDYADLCRQSNVSAFQHSVCVSQPTPVFLPGESQGLGSLVGCCLWGRTQSDTTEVT